VLFACGQEEASQEGDDLTLNSVIAINDLPAVGPVSVKQAQMFSDDVMRSQMSTSISIAGEAQEILTVYIINLNEGNIYYVNDSDSTYVRMSFAELDALLDQINPAADTTGAQLELLEDQVRRMEDQAEPIPPFGECVPVEFDLVLGGTGENADYRSSMQGQMWLSESIENDDVYMDFNDEAMVRFKNDIAGNAMFFGIAASVNLNQGWFESINESMTGVPVQAEFKITMPTPEETITYGMTMNLEDYSTADIDESLLAVPAGYREVSLSEFRMY
jgi:hypothetical protein